MRKMRETGTALMNAREMRLVLASAPRNLMELSRRELMGMVRRARGMVTQYEKLADRLRREARRVPMGSRMMGGSLDTRRKAALFRTALTRFEAQLSRMEKAPARKARPTMRKRPTAKKAMRPAARTTPVTRKKAITSKKAMQPAGYARRGPVKTRTHKPRRIPGMKARANTPRRMPGMKTQAHRTTKTRMPTRRTATR
ncbi:hypothetical protein JYK02_09735 [Corallococcus macrosporus]|uniref:Uncharacterized protein n=1 Tax=Corallococcus macrosporus TaxID=35 RepID=A0ABS3D9T0_9BACT|nr:hypothetical protein [Corallococcus macrosporus]MBN8227790.1 hypothetical protein [Corallococcus macrosporus]